MLHRVRRTRRIAVITSLSTMLVLSPVTLGVTEAAPAVAHVRATGVVAQRGDFSLLVARIQQILLAAGIPLPGGVDGAYGRGTERAVTQYQGNWHLPQNGVVDTPTAIVMGLVPATPLLSKGASGPAVSAVQQQLVNLGITVRGGVDGSYGSGTTAAVRAFQTSRGLPATGNVDAATAAILANLAGGTPSTSPSPSPSLTPSPSPSPAPSDQVTGANLATFPLPATCRFWDTWGAPRSGGRRHQGVDIFAASGTIMYAVRSGTISKQQHNYQGSLAGNALWLTTADGTYYFYAHLKGFASGIGPGSKVKAGDVIGYVGKTGNAPVPHLHFEVHPGGGAAVNPYPYVKAVSNC